MLMKLIMRIENYFIINCRNTMNFAWEWHKGKTTITRDYDNAQRRISLKEICKHLAKDQEHNCQRNWHYFAFLK